MQKMNIVAPWINYFHEVVALFKPDPEVKVTFDTDTYELKIYVEDQKKAEAIEYIMPKEREFGNVTVKILVIPANHIIDSYAYAFKYAFRGNYNFYKVVERDTPFGNMPYAIFSPNVIQYYNDDIGDINGKRTTTVEEVAKEVLDVGNVHVCSATLLSNRDVSDFE